jgi:predicted signal transduction protein with EAL and GGDEF domain
MIGYGLYMDDVNRVAFKARRLFIMSLILSMLIVSFVAFYFLKCKKVDKIFTQAVGNETVNYITLDGIFSMLEHLAVKIVFEWVETEKQRAYIHQKIPNAISQGWLFAKPQKIDALMKLISLTKD